MNEDWKQIEQQGYAAHDANPIGSNPRDYALENELWRAWRDGWLRRARDLEQEEQQKGFEVEAMQWGPMVPDNSNGPEFKFRDKGDD